MKYVPKYAIDHLLEHYYEHKISNDIDLDPCKTGKSLRIKQPIGTCGDDYTECLG